MAAEQYNNASVFYLCIAVAVKIRFSSYKCKKYPLICSGYIKVRLI